MCGRKSTVGSNPTATASVLSRDIVDMVSRLRHGRERRFMTTDRGRDSTLGEVRMQFSGEVIEWRGPAPYLFLRLPEAESTGARERPEDQLRLGVYRRAGNHRRYDLQTSLMPRDGRYLLPVKVVVQRAEEVDLGDRIHGDGDGHRAGVDGGRRSRVRWLDGALEGDEQALHSAGTHPALDLGCGDGLERQPFPAHSLRIFSSLSPDILPPMRPSRTSTTLYWYAMPATVCRTPWADQGRGPYERPRLGDVRGKPLDGSG